MDDNRIGDEIKSGIDAATQVGGGLADKARTAATQAGSTIRQAATEARVAADYVSKQGAQAAQYVSRNTAEQPWAALLIAGAIGYALAYLVHAR
jgi:ElaB/YqjD/DUF883 family membrane-anchored ribosome-binding protein